MSDLTPSTRPSLAEQLHAEFLSVGIPATLSGPTAFRPHSAVTVSTGAVPATVDVRVSGHGFHWRVEGRDHGHDLDAHMSPAAVTELVALCVAGRCQDVSVGRWSAQVGSTM